MTENLVFNIGFNYNDALNKATSDVSSKFNSVGGNVNVKLNANTPEINKAADAVSNIGKEAKKSESETKALGKSLDSMAGIGKIALGAFGGSAITGGISSITGGFKDMISAGLGASRMQNELKIGFQTAGVPASELSVKLKENANSVTSLSSKYAVSGEAINQLTSVYLKMGGSTDNLARKQELILGLAERTGMGYEGAAKAMAKATDPEIEAQLTKFGIKFDKNATEAERFQIISEKLGGTLGAMAENTKAPEGQIALLEMSIKKIKTTLGSAIIEAFFPFISLVGGALTSAFQTLASVLKTVTGFMNQSVIAKTIFTGLAIAITVASVAIGVMTLKTQILAGWTAVTTAATTIWGAAVAVASGIATAATTAWSVAQWLLNAAMYANPIGVIVVAIGAFIGGIILAYYKIEWFRNFVDAAWEYIKMAFNIGVSVVMFYINTIVSVFTNIINGVVNSVKALMSGDFTGAYNAIKGIGENITKDFRKNLIGTATEIQGAYNEADNAVKKIYDSHQTGQTTAQKGAKKLTDEEIRQQEETKRLKTLIDGLGSGFTKAAEASKKGYDDSKLKLQELLLIEKNGGKLTDDQISVKKKIIDEGQKYAAQLRVQNQIEGEAKKTLTDTEFKEKEKVKNKKTEATEAKNIFSVYSATSKLNDQIVAGEKLKLETLNLSKGITELNIDQQQKLNSLKTDGLYAEQQQLEAIANKYEIATADIATMEWNPKMGIKQEDFNKLKEDYLKNINEINQTENESQKIWVKFKADTAKLNEEIFKVNQEIQNKNLTLQFKLGKITNTQLIDSEMAQVRDKVKTNNDEMLALEKKLNDEKGVLNEKERAETQLLLDQKYSLNLDFQTKTADLEKSKADERTQSQKDYLTGLNDDFGKAFENIFQTLLTFNTDADGSIEGVTLSMDNLSNVTEDSWAKVGSAVGQQMGIMLAKGEDLKKGMGKLMLDALDSAIPAIVAAIFGQSIAQLGPIGGAIASGLLIGLFKGFIAVAKSALGAEEGVVGISSSYSKRAGRTDTIPLMVAPGESIFSKFKTDQHRSLFEHLQMGGSEATYFMKHYGQVDNADFKTNNYIADMTYINNGDGLKELVAIKNELTNVKKTLKDTVMIQHTNNVKVISDSPNLKVIDNWRF